MLPLSYPRTIRVLPTLKRFPHIRRMNSLVLNGVGMTALSACFMTFCSAIFAHYTGLPDLNYENEPSLISGNKALWLHFILDEGEQTSEIWTWESPLRIKGIVVSKCYIGV